MFTEEPKNHWISYSDLMSGLLFVFILLFVLVLVQHKKSIDLEKKNLDKIKAIHKMLKIELEEQKLIVGQTKVELDQQKIIVEKTRNKLHKKQDELQNIEATIKKILEVKKRIIQLLMLEFKKKGLSVKIDPFTGAIQLPSKVLFDSNSYWLKSEGEMTIREFFPSYIEVLLHHPQVSPFIAQIMVEGHTDPKSSYLYNLELSQKRALSVVKYIMKEESFGKEDKLRLRDILTANGRSFMEPIMQINNSETVDFDKSRRVVFKFRLKSEKQLEKIQGQIDRIGNDQD